MNAFTDILFIFVYVFILLNQGIITITNTNVVTQKIYMFLAVSAFASALYALKCIRMNYVIKFWDMIYSGLFIGLLAYIGHTALFDMWYMTESRDWLAGVINADTLTLNVLLSLFICISITVGKSVKHIFNTDPMCS